MKETKYKMANTLKEIIKKQEEDIIMEYGFDSKDKYDEKQLWFIKYAISKFGGMRDKVRIAKCLYIVDKLIEFVTSDDEDNEYENIGRFVCDILDDCGYIKIASYE